MSGPDRMPPSKNSRNVLDIEAVIHSYAQGTDTSLRVIEDVDLSIGKGEFVAVVGPSGCGKTTLLRLAAGLITPSAGTVRVFGTVVREPHAEVSVIFQDAVMLPWFNILDNVTLPLRIRGADMKAGREKARELLAQVGLEGFAEAFPKQLSGGMRQRAAIVRALISEPGLLLMDEPFGALDALTRAQMNLELARVAEQSGCSVLLITHSISEAIFLADRVVVMTPRPARIAEVVEINLPRPRTRQVQLAPAFIALQQRIGAHFEQA